MIFGLLLTNTVWALDAVLIQVENSNQTLPILKKILEKNYNIPKQLIKIEYRPCGPNDALIHFCIKNEELSIKKLNRTFYRDNFLQFKELAEETIDEEI